MDSCYWNYSPVGVCDETVQCRDAKACADCQGSTVEIAGIIGEKSVLRTVLGLTGVKYDERRLALIAEEANRLDNQVALGWNQFNLELQSFELRTPE